MMAANLQHQTCGCITVPWWWLRKTPVRLHTAAGLAPPGAPLSPLAASCRPLHLRGRAGGWTTGYTASAALVYQPLTACVCLFRRNKIFRSIFVLDLVGVHVPLIA